MLLYQIVADLLPFVAALYLLECLSFTRAPGVLFAERVAGGFRLRRAGLRLLPVLPWLRAYSTVELPYLLSEEAIWVPHRRDLVPGRFFERDNFLRLDWDELREVRVEHRHLGLDGSAVLFPSPAHATAHALRLEALRRLDRAKRAARVGEEAARALRLGTVEELEGRIRHIRRSLDLVCTALFAFTFLVVPASVVVQPLASALPWLLVVLVPLLGFVAVLVVRAARRLEGAGMRTDGLLLPLVLSPPSLVRASIDLAVHLLQGVEAVAVAVALLGRDQAVAALRRELHSARYAAGQEGGGADPDASDWCEIWTLRVRLLERLAEQAGLDLMEIQRPPASEETAAGGTYCPYCDGAFASELTCPTCAMPTIVVE